MHSTRKIIAKELAKKYGYAPYMIEHYIDFLGENETIALLEANEHPVSKTIRVNTLKTSISTLKKALKKRGFKFTSMKELDEGLTITKEPFSISATPEHAMGHFFIQVKASMLAVIALDPRKDELIWDMAAAPGGKTTHVAQIMQNTGTIICTEMDRNRINVLRSNISRCGVTNAICYKIDAAKLVSTKLKFDRVLLDAPCTGEGLIPLDPSRKKSRSIEDILVCTKIQKKLIDSAMQMLKPGGVLLYSTCSLAPEENEENVEYILDKYAARLLSVPFEGAEGIETPSKILSSSERKKIIRLYPHVHNTIGFFIAKFEKTG